MIRTSSPTSVPFGASYTYTHAEFRQDFDSADPIYGTVERGYELPYVPPHQLSARLGLEAPSSPSTPR